MKNHLNILNLHYQKIIQLTLLLNIGNLNYIVKNYNEISSL